MESLPLLWPQEINNTMNYAARQTVAKMSKLSLTFAEKTGTIYRKAAKGAQN